MPKRKTKKTTRSKTSIKGKKKTSTPRAKSKKAQISKKTQRKKTVKRQTVRSLNRKKTPLKKSIKTKKKKSSKTVKAGLQKKTNKLSKFATALKKHNSNLIKSRPSPHVIDLRKVQAEKNQQSKNEQRYAQYLSQEIFDKFNQKTTNLANQAKNTYNNIKTLKPKPKARPPIARKITPAKPKLNIKFKPRLPQISFDIFKIELPKFEPKEIKLGKIILPATWKKTIIGFVVLSLIFVLPFTSYGYYQNLQAKKNRVLSQAADALFHLALSKKAASAQDFYYTQYELLQATTNFSQAKTELADIGIIVQSLIKTVPSINRQYQTAQKIINAGEKLTNSAAILTQALDQIDFSPELDSLNLTEKIINFKNSLNLVLPDISEANQDIQSIDLSQIPQEYKPQIRQLQKALPLLEENMSNFISYSDLILKTLGHDYKKRYLLLFQNNNEIRPTGGFIGSFAIVDIDRGNIEKINIPGGGPYDLKAGLRVNVQAPKPLRIINPRWEFQDANWFPDLPTSAEKIMWLYEKSGGPSVDGLILINATFLQDILKIIGPIELPEHGKIITYKNFFDEVQSSVENEYDKEINKPKQIIADLTPQIINQLLNSDQQQFIEIIDLIFSNLNEKNIQLYFSDYSLEKLVLKYNWGGQIKQNNKDYLAVVSTNIAGEKTDAKIKQLASLQVDIQNDGSVNNTLSITKTHTGQIGQDFYGVPNLDYLRVYVPEGSQLISATGFDPLPEELFSLLDPEKYDQDDTLAIIEDSKTIDAKTQTEIYIESSKTVFANWIKVNPGETKTVSLKYKLPFNLDLRQQDQSHDYIDILKKEFNLESEENLESYSLFWQKQSGKENFKINTQINFPENIKYQILHPDSLTASNNNSFIYANDLTTDQLIAIIFQQK